MNKLIVLLAVCLSSCFGVDVNAQTAKGVGKKPVASAITEKCPVVIAVEDGQVYIDLLDEPVVKGDRIVVYNNDTYFIHPVTKERIQRDTKDIAEMEVVKVSSSYIQAVPKPAIAISMIKPGMKVRKREHTDIVVPVEPVGDESEINEVLPQIDDRQYKEQHVLDAIVEINKQCPLKLSKDVKLLDIMVEGKTIYYNKLVTSKLLYKGIKKSIGNGKLYNEKTFRELMMNPFYVDAREAGFSIADRWWNPNKSEHMDYTIFL